MKLNFKEQLIAAAMGFLSLGLPSLYINEVTAHLAPAEVTVGIMLASLTGYGYAYYNASKRSESLIAQSYAEGYTNGSKESDQFHASLQAAKVPYTSEGKRE